MDTKKTIGLALLFAIGCSSGLVQAQNRLTQPGEMGGLLGVGSEGSGTVNSQQAAPRQSLEQWVISGGALVEAYYHGYVVTGQAGDGNGGQWIYFRRVVSWDGYGVNDAGYMEAATVTFGPELYVYYP